MVDVTELKFEIDKMECDPITCLNILHFQWPYGIQVAAPWQFVPVNHNWQSFVEASDYASLFMILPPRRQIKEREISIWGFSAS